MQLELTIYEKFQNLIPPEQPSEYQLLEENILRDGCTTPLDVWPHDGKMVIVDGHHRYKICKKHGIPFEVHEIHFESEEDAKIWIIRNQLGRRNLLPFDRAQLALILEPILASKAKERQATSTGGATPQLRPKWDEAENGRTDEELATIAGISKNSIRRAKMIKEKGTPQQIERAKKGGKGNSINAIYTEIKHRNIKEKTCPMCGKTLPIDRFYGEGATCKTCTEIRKQTLLNGGTVSYQKDTTKEEPEEAPEFTVEDLAGLLDAAMKALDNSLKLHLVLTHNDMLKSEDAREAVNKALSSGREILDKYENMITEVAKNGN